MDTTHPPTRDGAARRPIGLSHSLPAKILLISLGGVLLSVLLSVLVLYVGMSRLSRDTSAELEATLGDTSRQHLENQIENTAARINLWMGHSQADLRILADVCQTLIDHADEMEPMNEALRAIPYFADRMQYDVEGGYSQNAPDEPTVVTLQSIYHDEAGNILPHPRQVIESTAILDLIMPAIHNQGAEKLWTYYCGDSEAAFLRMTPWVDFGRDAIENYPEQMDVPYWDFFPGLMEAWEAQLHGSESERALGEIITFYPTIDATSSEMIQIFGHPLWNAERTACAGAVWHDLQMDEITHIVRDMQFTESGFAFLMMADGNVISIPDRGSEALGLQPRIVSDGHLLRSLSESSMPDVTALSLPQDDTVTFGNLRLAGEDHILVMRRLDTMNLFRDEIGRIVPQHNVLCFAIPMNGIYGPLYMAQATLSGTFARMMVLQAVALAILMALVMVLSLYLVKRVTRGLARLSVGASRIAEGALETRVEVRSQDELGALGRAFNEMAHQVETSYTQLENRNDSLRREIRERQEAEQALRESQDRLVRVVGSMPVLMDAFDENKHLVVWNAECERVTGYCADEIISNPESMRLLYPDENYYEQMMGEWARQGNDFIGWEWELTAKDGTIRTVSWSNISDRFPIPGWSSWGVGVDVTDRVRAEAELRQHREQLEQLVDERTAELLQRIAESEQLNRSMINLLQDLQATNHNLEATTRRLEAANQDLDDFAYVISHDLKAPLRGVNQLATWIVEDHGDALDDDGVHKLHLLTDRVQRMHVLIDGVLQYSRAGRSPELAGPVDMDQLMRDVIEILDPPPHVQVDIEGALPTIIGDATQLSQVCQNLLENAFKFCIKPSSRVTISCAEEGTHWRFNMADNGPGIAPRHHDRVFRLFQTLSPQDEPSSTGVGLALVKRIVERGGGRVWIESTLGEGATFYWTWPKREVEVR